jgi:hypothetical protein
MVKLVWGLVIVVDSMLAVAMVGNAIHPTRDYGGSLVSQQVMYLVMAGIGLGTAIALVTGWRWRAAKHAGLCTVHYSHATRTALALGFASLSAVFLLFGIGMFVYWGARVLFDDVPASMLLLWPVQCLIGGGIHLLALWLAWRHRPWMWADSAAIGTLDGPAHTDLAH